MPVPTLDQWIGHLKQLAMPVLKAVPFDGSAQAKMLYIDEFRDEYGSRRDTDSALLSKVLKVSYESTSADETSDLDLRLWEALHTKNSDWESWISKTGGLVADIQAIEQRTLIELCSMHALFHLIYAGDQINTAMQDRINSLVDWHTQELQPDNAINRPWGVVACIARAVSAQDADCRLSAMLHAQTLINNCCISMGQPDRLSAFILLDSANSLEQIFAGK